jgi:hypothetical protein
MTWPFRRLDAQPFRARRQFVGGHQLRAEAAGAVEVFTDGPLRRAFLVVAHRHVVEAGVAKDVLQGLLLRDVARTAPITTASSAS